MTPIEPSRREHPRIVLGYGGRNELCARATKQIYLQISPALDHVYSHQQCYTQSSKHSLTTATIDGFNYS